MQLSERQREIAGLMAQGYSPKGISEKLSLAKSTVKTHINEAYAKIKLFTDYDPEKHDIKLLLALYAIKTKTN